MYIQIGMLSIPKADHVNLLLSVASAPMQPADMGEFDRVVEGIFGLKSHDFLQFQLAG